MIFEIFIIFERSEMGNIECNKYEWNASKRPYLFQSMFLK